MKNNKKMFFLTETLLAVMVIAVAFIMVRERNGKEQDKISVIIQDLSLIHISEPTRH